MRAFLCLLACAAALAPAPALAPARARAPAPARALAPALAPAPTPRHYLYVAVPSAASDIVDRSERSVRIVVFDVGENHRFVRSIALWNIAPGDDAETVRGTAADARARRLYISTTKRLAAVDLDTDAVVWQRSYQERCCDRLALSPDGRTIYAPAFGRARWYVVDAASGDLRRSLDVSGWPRQTRFSRDGRFAYLGAWESATLFVSDTAKDEVVRTVGPFSASLCPFTANAKGTLAFANVDGLVGFEVGDLQTGLILDRVVADASVAAAAYECPSHGIAFTPDERELWIADGVSNQLHVFDATVYPPVAHGIVRLPAQPRWIAFDAGGRYAYVSTGDVVSAATKAIVGALEERSGVKVSSESFLDLEVNDGRPIR